MYSAFETSDEHDYSRSPLTPPRQSMDSKEDVPPLQPGLPPSNSTQPASSSSATGAGVGVVTPPRNAAPPPYSASPSNAASPTKPMPTTFKAPEGNYQLERTFQVAPEVTHFTRDAKVSRASCCLVAKSELSKTGMSEQQMTEVKESSDADSAPILLCNVSNILQVVHSKETKLPLAELTVRYFNPICHDICVSREGKIWCVVGAADGSLIVFDPFASPSGSYIVHNQEGVVDSTKAMSVRWLPKADGELSFVVGHQSGRLYLYDASAQDPTASPKLSFPASPGFHAKKMGSSSNTNPVGCWRLTEASASLEDVAISSDGNLVAAVGKDGFLTVFDISSGRLITQAKSYYGGLTCVDWSPDAKYLLTGGEDDMVTVWGHKGSEYTVLARGIGHQSWVTQVKWDSRNWETEEEVHRFLSVGLDAQLLVWDFSFALVRLPRRPSQSRSRGNSFTETPDIKSAVSQAQPLSRLAVPTIDPLSARKIHQLPVTALAVIPAAVLTMSESGSLKVWRRPQVINLKPQKLEF